MNWKRCKLFMGTAVVVLAGFGFTLAGCSTPTAATGAGPSKDTARKGAPVGQRGAQLWAQTGGHCHNIRSPSSYSDAQWDVAMLHMRVRANLTAEEHQQILAFLKSAH